MSEIKPNLRGGLLSTQIIGVPLWRWAVLGLLILVLVGVSVLIRRQLNIDWNLTSLRTFVQGLGAWGPIAFVGILTFRFMFLIPTGLLLLAGGIIFGPVYGTIYAGFGMFLSGMLKFGLIAVLGRERVLGTLPLKLQNWVNKLARGRMSVWALMGICAYPFFPKHVFQYAAILSGMGLTHFVMAVLSGCMVQAFLFANVGEAIYSGTGIAVSSGVLLVSILLPLSVPAWRAWMLGSFRDENLGDKKS